MTRIDIINDFISKNNYTTYLEIGCDNNSICFDLIKAPWKVGVDPQSGGTIRMTSDEFFKVNAMNFDVIFIDGLHYEYQVYKDIINSLAVCNGVIVCHDMNPYTDIMQRVPREQEIWTGDCWKAWVKLRQERSDLEMYVLDTDMGVGIIRKGNQDLITVDCEINYDNFCKHKNYWLNLKHL